MIISSYKMGYDYYLRSIRIFYFMNVITILYRGNNIVSLYIALSYKNCTSVEKPDGIAQSSTLVTLKKLLIIDI